MKPTLSVISLSLALGLLLYAVPRLEIGGRSVLAGVFAVAWLGIVLLIVAAHLYRLLGVDESTRKEIDRVRLYRKWRTRKWMESKGL